jgi:hypothetical protein
MLYDAPMVLVRPDGHVAWRGDARESHVAGVIRTVRGAGPQIVARRTAP